MTKESSFRVVMGQDPTVRDDAACASSSSREHCLCIRSYSRVPAVQLSILSLLTPLQRVGGERGERQEEDGGCLAIGSYLSVLKTRGFKFLFIIINDIKSQGKMCCTTHRNLPYLFDLRDLITVHRR